MLANGESQDVFRRLEGKSELEHIVAQGRLLNELELPPFLGVKRNWTHNKVREMRVQLESGRKARSLPRLLDGSWRPQLPLMGSSK